MKMAFLLFSLIFTSLCGTSWVIVANGPTINSDQLKERLKNRKILVLDGAANRFKDLGLYPDYILGDFDSVEDPAYWGISTLFSELGDEALPYSGNFGTTIVPAKDQNHTDLEKGILFSDKLNASSIHIVQATGGRMDHTLGNLGALKKYYKPERELVLITETEQIFYLCNQAIAIEGGVGGHCAVMGYPKAFMTTTGLAYNGKDYLVELGVQESTCNMIEDPNATISIQGEALIILPKSCKFKMLD